MGNRELVNQDQSNKVFRKTRKKLSKWTKRVVKVRRITKVIKGGKISINQKNQEIICCDDHRSVEKISNN